MGCGCRVLAGADSDRAVWGLLVYLEPVYKSVALAAGSSRAEGRHRGFVQSWHWRRVSGTGAL